MPSVCLYLKAHQPYRIKNYRVFDIGADSHYFNDTSERDINNEKVLKKVAEKSYRPTNKILLSLLKKYPEFRVSFSLTGVLLDQLEKFAPDVIESFQELVKTGQVEILAETYHHTLSFFYAREEFEEQVIAHEKKIKELFGLTPKVFSNTELAYNNELAQWADKKGYKGIITEEEFMQLIDYLKIEFDAITERFNKMDEKFDRIDERFTAIDQQFVVVERNFDKVFQQLNYHSTRLEYIEKNMVHKSQFKSLVGILERKEVITNFDASHVLYKPSE
jgi:predicted transcriptional regulator